MTRVYLLAAGRGRRAGGPKAWLESEGRPLLQRQLDFLGSRFPSDSLAVSIQDAWLERCRALDSAVRWTAVDPDASPLASLQALLKEAPAQGPTFLLHVDMPVWDSAVWSALEAASLQDAAVPTQGGRRGHPVLLSPESLKLIAGLDASQDRLDVWLRGRRVIEVPVAADCVLANWNEVPA